MKRVIASKLEAEGIKCINAVYQINNYHAFVITSIWQNELSFVEYIKQDAVLRLEIKRCLNAIDWYLINTLKHVTRHIQT